MKLLALIRRRKLAYELLEEYDRSAGGRSFTEAMSRIQSYADHARVLKINAESFREAVVAKKDLYPRG